MMDNRQYKTTQQLTPVRNARQFAGTILTIVGSALFAAGAIPAVLSIFFTGRAAVISLATTGGTLALVGIIQLIIAAALKARARNEQETLERLKNEGHSFPAEITNIVHQAHVRVGHTVSVYAECTYKNNDGKTCLVRSKLFLHKGENYTAWVYVNPFDPTDYAVEIFAQAPQVHADYDYR